MNSIKYLLLPVAAVMMSAVGISSKDSKTASSVENPPRSDSMNCPYYAPPSHPDTNDTEDPSIPVYKHCSECNIGALLDHEDGIVKCSYCGKRG